MTGAISIKASMRSADVGHLADEITRLEDAGIDGFHFDVMDGRFGHEISMGPTFVKGLRRYTRLPFDVHLWVENPEDSIDQYLEAEADCVLVHIEASQRPADLLAKIRDAGCKTGLAINPATPATRLAPYADLCDEFNVMAISPGRPGVLDEAGVEKLSQIARIVAERGGLQTVQADGAVSQETRDLFVTAGASAMVVGYPVFSRDEYGAAISELRNGLS